MKKLPIIAIVLCFVSSAFAELTQQQKVSDFMALAALYDKNYGPYEWKLKVFGFDLLKIQPWLAQVEASTDDLSFYDICVRYVASLNDFHDEYTLPSFYEAVLPFTVDIYDGKILVDSLLDPSLPFSVGDELVSLDGTSVGDLITALGPYAVNGQGNPVSRNRLAAAAILNRLQEWYTYANKVKDGDTAAVQIKSSGKVTTYMLTWAAGGVPLNGEGPVPNPRTTSVIPRLGSAGTDFRRSIRERARATSNLWGIWTGAPAVREVRSVPSYMEPLRRLQNFSHAKPNHPVAGSIDPFGSMFPVFNPPAGFQPHLGSKQTDEFLSGTFPVGKLTIGYIRIPSFEPNSETNALKQFQDEIAYFQQNTNGLVIDVMANGGGFVCYTNNLLQYLNPKPFRSIGFELRATENWVLNFEASIFDAEANGAPQSTIDLYTAYLAEVQQALSQNRGLTGPLPICTQSFTYPPATDDKGNNLAYTKPIVVLTDNFSASAAELFSATLQDAQRATVYGVRTSGGGGDEVSFDTTPYSEGSARVTLSLAVRAKNITTPGFPSAPLIENIGVYPDVAADYQTLDNLLNGGQTFVSGFTKTITNLITAGHP